MLSLEEKVDRAWDEIKNLRRDHSLLSEEVWAKLTDYDQKIGALKSHVTPIPRLMGDAEKLQKEMSETLGRLPMIEEDVENLENAAKKIGALLQYSSDSRARLASLEWETKELGKLTQCHEEALHSHAKMIARLMSATVQLFPRGDAPDPLSFLISCDGALDCSPDGEMRLIFPEDTAVPLSDLMTAASLLRAHDPEGTIDVPYEGGIVVRLRPSPKEVGE